MTYTAFVNQHSISYAGLFVIFLSLLLRGFSKLLLIAVLVTLFHEQLSISLFFPLIYSFFILVIFFSNKNFPGQMVSFWSNFGAQNKYCYFFVPIFFCKILCFSKILCSKNKKIFLKINTFKIGWPSSVIIKSLVFIPYIVMVYNHFQTSPLFWILLFGYVSELLSHALKLLFFGCCHVWKDILPIHVDKKKNFKIFSSKYEIIPD